jgi:hypothetical protein
MNIKLKSLILINITEACAAVGHSVHMPPLFQNRWGICPPWEYAPPLKFEIVCFCPSWKKLSGGADGADSKAPPVTSLLLIFSRPPKIHCYYPYLFLGKLNLSYQICVWFIFIYMKFFKWTFKTGFLSTKSPFEFVF